MRFLKYITGNGLLVLLLAAWWLLNVWQAAMTELANDEAYYWFFSQALDWGYYDHPPMVAFLIWLTSFIPDELGVRLVTTLLQPIYLYLFWTLIRPQHPSWRDAWIYFVISLSFPLLHLYGFLALPDAPLLFFTVVFLWTYVRYERSDTLGNATLMAVAMALLVYSKYHGVLVIFFVLLSNLKLLRRWRIYYAVVVALLLFVPHLWWQYQHDFATFRYHLIERSGDAVFAIGNIGNFLLNLMLVFNPVWVVGGYWMYRKVKDPDKNNGIVNPLQRALAAMVIGFVLFFLVAACRDKTQPQWLLPVIFAPMACLYYTVRRSDEIRRFVNVLGIVCTLFFVLARVMVVVNPCQWKGELWNNKIDNKALATWAAGRPILFCADYTQAAKYCFYTHQPAYAQAVHYGRTSQWQYCDWDDSLFASPRCEAIINDVECTEADTLLLPSGRVFSYFIMPQYHPIRKVWVEPVGALDTTLNEGEPLTMTLDIYNPYNYDFIPTTQRPLCMIMFWRINYQNQPGAYCPITDTLPAHSHTQVRCSFPIPKELMTGEWDYAFSFRYLPIKSVCSSSWHHATLQRNKGNIQINNLK